MITNYLRIMQTTFIGRLRSSTAGSVFILLLLIHPMAEHIKLHPIGDSTTYGYETESCWRYYLYKKILESGCDSIDFVGSLNSPTKGSIKEKWDRDHDGHTSSKASQILNGGLAHGHKGSIKEWAPEFTPHIAVIYLGTNDIRGRRKTADIIKTFEDIIQIIRDARNEAKIVVCQLPYWNWGKGGSKEAVDDLNAAIPSLKELGTQISPIKIVDLNTDYSLKDLRDRIHPGPSGAQKIADRVFKAIAPWLDGTVTPISRDLQVTNQANRTGLKSGLHLSIQNNMPTRLWIAEESGSALHKGRGYLISGKKISLP